MSNSKLPQRPKKEKTTDLLPEVKAQAPLVYRSSAMPAQEWQHLRAGKIQPAATLDLHGLTMPEAEIALERFLHKADQQDWMVVKVIHGKGSQTAHQYPVIKNLVNQYLRAHPHVLAFTSTPPRFGGTGAVYVWLQPS
jgi:DNA-nicking Smr family endonuclease